MVVRFKQCLKIISLLALLVVLIGNVIFSFAQEKQIEPSMLPKDTCLQNFDIDTNVNFKHSKMIRSLPLLAPYFQALAIVRDDIRECDRLNPWPDRVNTCREYFDDYHGFYGRLLKANQPTPEVLSFCVNKFKLNIEECKLYATAWLKSDLSYCEKVKDDSRKFADCKAMISGDTNSCGGNDSCINKAAYFKALKTLDLNECNKIRDPNVKLMCQGYISMDEKVCQNNKGFEEFRNNYCSE